MSDSKNFSGTITGGIQDISALLPLLGTEQCEKHVGSALDKGFLYSSVTPVSIFGSLGIVRAAFNILVAGISVERFNFLGATTLRDGGFSPAGDVAPMIAMDPAHPERFLAETKLESMLTEDHIENAEHLTVSWGEGIFKWNFFLVASTLITASAGLLPYILVVLDSDNATSGKLFPLGFGFPILRVVGSALCVILAQILMQIRLLILLKTRLLFITIDRVAKSKDIDIARKIQDRFPGREWARNAWNAELASERCIWALRKYLTPTIGVNEEPQNAASPPEDEESRFPPAHGEAPMEMKAATSPSGNGGDTNSLIKDLYDAEYRRQMEPIDACVPCWVHPILVFGLVLGGCSTVAGYIGCFYIIQHSVNSNGPLLWLLLEALLSVLRILVWAINPSWDDSKGIVFKLQLASRPLLVTCNKVNRSIGDLLPVVRSKPFLEDVVAYTGPTPALVVPDVALYYSLVALKYDSRDRRLYVVVSDHKEQTSRLLFKEVGADAFSIYKCTLEPVLGSTTINARVGLSKERGKTDATTHFLTYDPEFMSQLGAHYDDITHKLLNPNPEGKATVNKTWAMKRLIIKDHKDDANSQSLAVQQEGQRSSSSMDAGTKAYLDYGSACLRTGCQPLEQIIAHFISDQTDALFEDISPGFDSSQEGSVVIAQQYEASEREFLLVEFQRIFESWLAMIARQEVEDLKTTYKAMVARVLNGASQSAGNLDHGFDITRRQRSVESWETKITRRLKNELDEFLAAELRTRGENMQTRLVAQMQRVQSRQYDEATRDAIVDAWKRIPEDIQLPPLGPPSNFLAIIDGSTSKYAEEQPHRYKKLKDSGKLDDNEVNDRCEVTGRLFFRVFRIQTAPGVSRDYRNFTGTQDLFTFVRKLAVFKRNECSAG